MRPPAPRPKRTISGTRPRGALVLIIDDVEEARVVSAQALKDRGLRVIEAGDGLDGLAKALAELPDAIVLDLSMPVLDGFDTARKLKENARTRTIPIIALTATGLECYERAIDAGCDLFLVKPCTDTDLAGIVELMISQRRRDQAGG